MINKFSLENEENFDTCDNCCDLVKIEEIHEVFNKNNRQYLFVCEKCLEKNNDFVRVL